MKWALGPMPVDEVAPEVGPAELQRAEAIRLSMIVGGRRACVHLEDGPSLAKFFNVSANQTARNNVRRNLSTFSQSFINQNI